MRKLTHFCFAITVATSLAIPAVSTFASEQPYKGLEKRDIKALSPDRVRGLLRGAGLSYALAAELNDVPGPRHVLDLAQSLDLSDEAKKKIEVIYQQMNKSARHIGQSIIEAEQALDALFSTKSASKDAVIELTDKISALEGQLRAVHLNAHLETAPLLSKHQRKIYAAARGYSDHAGHKRHGHGEH